MSKFQDQLNSFFLKFNQHFDEKVPEIIAEEAINTYRGSFDKKAWDGKPWPKLSKNYKPKSGTMMHRSTRLERSIKVTTQTSQKVIISAGGGGGNSKVDYARVHNEGGTISYAARSETFVRNRIKKTTTKGKKTSRKGQFRVGTIPGQGFSRKAYSMKMPKRQFMGFSGELNRAIIKRISRESIFK